MSFFSFQPIPESSPYYLEPFSLPHLVALTALICLAVLIIVFRERLGAWKGEPRLRLVATIIAISLEAAFHFLQYFTQGWYDFLRGLIPFELCAIALWLAVALNALKSRGVWQLLYFWGLGAAVSFVFANTDGANYNTFHFYDYFIVHGYILLTMVWFGAVHGYRISLAALLKAIGILFPITIALRLFDSAFADEPFKFNFMFLLSPPDVPTPLDGFGHGWGYYFAFVGLSAAVFVAAWLPWGISAAFRRYEDARSIRAPSSSSGRTRQVPRDGDAARTNAGRPDATAPRDSSGS
jgi:hypothetical integral membrane protein (TIGR02206 family)